MFYYFQKLNLDSNCTCSFVTYYVFEINYKFKVTVFIDSLSYYYIEPCYDLEYRKT